MVRNKGDIIMKWKKAIVFGLLAVAGLGYTYWPSPDPMKKYQSVAVPAPADRQQDLTRLMKAVMEASKKGQYQVLEKAFGMNPRERLLHKETDGFDPVETSLEVLRTHAAELRWSDYEMNSFEKNPKRFEVHAKTQDGKKMLHFSILAQGKKYCLLSIAEG